MKTKYQIVGEYFGYPNCCVESFEKGLEKTLAQHNVHKNKGFIPCDKCARHLIKNSLPIESLIKNRKCKQAFPKEGVDWELERYINEYPEKQEILEWVGDKEIGEMDGNLSNLILKLENWKKSYSDYTDIHIEVNGEYVELYGVREETDEEFNERLL